MTVIENTQGWHDSAAGARFRTAGLWGDLNVPELFDRQVERWGSKLAVVDDHVRWTYLDLQDYSMRAAQVLLDLGVRAGDAVAVQVASCALIPALHLAANRVGAVFAPLSSAWRAAELKPLLETVQAGVLLIPGDGPVDHAQIVDSFAAELPQLRHILKLRHDGDASFDDLVASASHPELAVLLDRRPSPDSPLHAMSTSGTTGVPKVSVWSGNNLHAMLLAQYGPAIGLRDDDIVAGIAPGNTGSTGYLFPILGPLLTGATSVILEQWSPKGALDMMQRERCTLAVAIPTQIVMLLDLPVEQHDLSSLRAFGNAGAPLAPAAAAATETRMGVRVQTLYGATDGGVPVCTSVDDPEQKRRTTVGRQLPGEELRLVTPDGADVPPGEPGEIIWRGANKSYGYLNQPDNDAIAWDHEGYFRSGDVGRLDNQGYLQIVGRLKDMILRGGNNIFPPEIEALLFEHDKIADVSIVGLPDDRLGERACAVVVPVRGGDLELPELTSFLAERGVAKYKFPESLVLTTELPRNAGGKIDKTAVRTLAAKAHT